MLEAFRVNRSKRQFFQVEPGLYLARYTRSAVEHTSPIVELQIEEPAPPGFGIISIPGKPLNLLSEVGDCAVIFAPTRGKLRIVAYSRTPNGTVDATVTLEPLGRNVRAAIDRRRSSDEEDLAELPLQPTKSSAVDIDILGHVAGRGDVWVKGGDWIAGPQDPARIEGLSIEIVPQSDAPDLVYGVIRASRQNNVVGRQVEKLVPPGTFAGSKGRATPLTGLKLQLRGRSRQTHWLEARVLFLGSPPVHQEGRQLSFVGPTGREPIIGLAISVKMVKGNSELQGAEAVGSGKLTPGKSGQRVRVFRSART